MKTLAALLLCITLYWEGLSAACPEPASLKDANGAKVCARMFEDSHYVYENSCKGKFLDAYPGEDVPNISLLWNNRVSSLVVARGCSLTVWDHYWKEGSKRKFTAGVQYRLKDVMQGLFDNWDNDISGYYCVC